MNDRDGSPNETLPEQVQRQNVTLQALIEAIGQLIAESRALLLKLQGGNSEEAAQRNQTLAVAPQASLAEDAASA